MNKCTGYGPDKLNLWPFYHLTFKCDLDLLPTWTNVSNGSSLSWRQRLCKIILKSMHRCTSYSPDKLNIWPFWHLFDPCDLALQPTWQNVSNSTFPSWGQQLCKIILQSMHKCTSYGPDKLNIWLFKMYLTPVTFTFILPKNVSNGTFPSWGKQLCKIILKSMHKCTSYGPHKLDIWHFDLHVISVTLTFNLPKNVSNGTFPPRGQQLCKIIIESMHKCTSCGPDELNIWLFRLLFDPFGPDLQPTWKNVSNGTFLPQKQQQIVLKSKHYCTSYGSDECGRMHAHIPHKNCNNYVSFTRKWARQKWLK